VLDAHRSSAFRADQLRRRSLEELSALLVSESSSSREVLLCLDILLQDGYRSLRVGSVPDAIDVADHPLVEDLRPVENVRQVSKFAEHAQE
jgi:hypothetical protein